MPYFTAATGKDVLVRGKYKLNIDMPIADLNDISLSYSNLTDNATTIVHLLIINDPQGSKKPGDQKFQLYEFFLGNYTNDADPVKDTDPNIYDQFNEMIDIIDKQLQTTFKKVPYVTLEHKLTMCSPEIDNSQEDQHLLNIFIQSFDTASTSKAHPEGSAYTMNIRDYTKAVFTFKDGQVDGKLSS